MQKTIGNRIVPLWKGTLLLACFAVGVCAAADSQQVKTESAGLTNPVGIAARQGGQVKGLLVIPMAEPPYPAVLAVDLLILAGLAAAFRRRITGIFN